jgi:hypothetical protein
MMGKKEASQTQQHPQLFQAEVGGVQVADAGAGEAGGDQVVQHVQRSNLESVHLYCHL